MMASLIQLVVNECKRIWDLRDTRHDDWFLMRSPMSYAWTLAIVGAYYYFVKILGPRLMENRKPFDLRRVLMAYNLFQIIFNCWMFYVIGMSGFFFGRYSFQCQAVDYSQSPDAILALRGGYWFFISKFIDFFDTIFFVLRKKNNQITTLHVAHHALMPVFLWPGVKYVPGGHSMLMALVNTLIHVIMYFYYLVAAMGPRYERFIWWKKYLTSFQMIQFVVITYHGFQLFYKNECGFPLLFSWMIGSAEFLFLCLFIHFYRTTYNKNRKAKSVANGTAHHHSSLKLNQNNNYIKAE